MPDIQLPLAEAERLCYDVLKNLGYDHDDAEAISQHLIDAEARGQPAKGMSLCLNVADHILEKLGIDGVVSSGRIAVTRSGPTHAQLNGNNAVGFLVANKAIRTAIRKAKKVGIAIVGASNTWYHGCLSTYAEKATQQGLIVIMTSNGSSVVAPYGGREGRFGTNPLLFGLPTSDRDRPVIYECGNSEILYADVRIAQRHGHNLPAGAACTAAGDPTTDPHQALPPAGFMTVFGGKRGSELASMVHLLGVMAGSAAQTSEMSDFGLLVIAIDPRILRDYDEFVKEVDAFCGLMRNMKLPPGASPVKMPFDEACERRAETMKRGSIEVAENTVEDLKRLTHSSVRWLI